ncbi:MAG: hypothetical protein V1750_08460 [Acidobacteriota bacterium]
MMPFAHASLASRFVEPLAHPWAVVTGGLLTELGGGEFPATLLRAAWRLLHFLLAL